MARNKIVSVKEAITHIQPDSAIMVGGFGNAGDPDLLVNELVRQGIGGLTVISNDLGSPNIKLGQLLSNNQVKAVKGTYYNWNPEVADAFNAGEIDVQLIPQGTLAEAIRAAGVGVPAFYTATGLGTELSKGKEVKEFDGREYVLERAVHADVALIKAQITDELGNLVYDKTARNFNPVMAMAADLVIAEVNRIVPAGDLDPECIVTPHLFVDYIVQGSDQS